LNNEVTISIEGFPIYHIDSTELVLKLKAKDRRTRIGKLQRMGVPIGCVGKDQYVSVIDVLEAFARLLVRPALEEKEEAYIPKSDGATNFLNILKDD